jgi:sugar lactone lactonase YvrE
MCTITNLNAQIQLKLIENAGRGKMLYADISRPDAIRLEWQVNGQTVATSGSSRKGVTVAGGHCTGSAANQLNNPNGVFVDKDDNLWVADTRNFRIQKFTPGNRNGVTIGAELPNAPSFPVNLFVKDNGDIYVADFFEAKIKLLKNGGTEWINVAGQNNELDLVRGVWVDKYNNVYCTQYGFFFNGTINLDGIVLKYPANSDAFEIVAGHNGIGSELNQFTSPSSLMMDEDLNMYIADGRNDHGNDNARVLKWAQGATEGVVVAGGNGEGEEPNQCAYPAHAFADKKGNVYVSQYNTAKVTFWRTGKPTREIVAGGNGEGDAADQFFAPQGIFLKGKYLWVSDSGNERVQRFDLDEKDYHKDFKPKHPGRYTAKATFEDGSTLESNAIEILSAATNKLSTAREINKLVAHPNPAINTVTVSFIAETSSRYLLELSDINGKILLRREVNATRGIQYQTFDLANYAKGTYLIKIIKPGNIKESIKVIRQ